MMPAQAAEVLHIYEYRLNRNSQITNSFYKQPIHLNQCFYSSNQLPKKPDSKDRNIHLPVSSFQIENPHVTPNILFHSTQDMCFVWVINIIYRKKAVTNTERYSSLCIENDLKSI